MVIEATLVIILCSRLSLRGGLREVSAVLDSIPCAGCVHFIKIYQAVHLRSMNSLYVSYTLHLISYDPLSVAPPSLSLLLAHIL